MKENLLGIDIGGTKCAVIFGRKDGENLEIVEKRKFPTTHVSETIAQMIAQSEKLMKDFSLTPENTHAVGVSCGGPLDSQSGVILSPPNLPGWDNIPIVATLEKELGMKAGIQNDANACALAEWKFGAGRGTRNMVFMTFGTGLGAGLILNGALYAGTNDNAGELGHIRLADFGPVGYGKSGSFEGFASGGGIAQLARMYVKEQLQMGHHVAWCPADKISTITAADVAQAAATGDALACRIYDTSATYLGRGLSIVIDLLNPEVIVIGSIYTRNEKIMKPVMQRILDLEALPGANAVCKVVPAQLGEQIGDYAALSVASNLMDN